jgi:(p)ppGpp synthase/HD superfamily hydrolase
VCPEVRDAYSKLLRAMKNMVETDRESFHKDFGVALSFATSLHASQLRKGTDIPYVSHLIGVAGIVLENGGGRDEAIAALLHDAIEDQAMDFPGGAPALRQEILTKFGSRVLDIVESCTDAETNPKPPWRARKEVYIAHLEHVSPEARLVSCADKLHNAQAIVGDLRVIGEALWARFNGGKDGTIWYYRSLASVFIRLGPKVLAEKLDRIVSEMEELANPPHKNL